ncbi:MAG: hypothetical protein KAX31_04660, partial [Thermoplasmata archaeon]|nr:hypothetical protein [Thermoplasmata archaeon]
GYVTVPGLCSGSLFANIYRSGDLVTPLYTTVVDDEDIDTYTAYHDFTWFDTNVVGNVPNGQSVVVELLVSASSGIGTTYNYDLADSDIPVLGTVLPAVTPYLETQVSDDSYEQITEAEATLNVQIFHETFPNVDGAWGGSADTPQDEPGWTTVQGSADANDVQVSNEDVGSSPSGGTHLTFEDCDDGVIPNPVWDWAQVPIDLSSYTNVNIEYYWQDDDCEAGSDWLYVDYYDGSSWTAINTHTGLAEDTWFYETFALPDVDATASFILRFSSQSQSNFEHFYVDDVRLTGDESLGYQLEHKWTIDVSGSAIEVLFGVEAYTSGEAMEFYYSMTGAGSVDTWNHMLDVTKLADDNAVQEYSLPVSTSGITYIGVIDSIRNPTDTTPHTVYIDYMYVRSVTSTGPEFVFGYDYGATQSYVEPTLAPGTPPPPFIDLAGISPGTWVFVSCPVEITGDVTTIFDDAAIGDGGTEWDYAQWYDNVNKEWRTYSIYKPPVLNDMDILDNTYGVWLHITANALDQDLTFGILGTYSAGPVFINLYAGWNLVGYPSATLRQADLTLPTGPSEVDMIAIYNASAAYRITDVSDLTTVTMSEGNAYWVRVVADCIWTVNP